MGCDIHSFAEVKKDGQWVKVEKSIFEDYGDKKTNNPFSWRNYEVFGFLADVRNYSHCIPLSKPKGLPNDSMFLNTLLPEPQIYSYFSNEEKIAYSRKEAVEYCTDFHSCSWLSLKELLDFDYDQTFWDRRVTKTIALPTGSKIINGAALAEEGEGKITTYREHLGEWFFKDLQVLETLGNPEDVRIVFWFDN